MVADSFSSISFSIDSCMFNFERPNYVRSDATAFKQCTADYFAALTKILFIPRPKPLIAYLVASFPPFLIRLINPISAIYLPIVPIAVVPSFNALPASLKFPKPPVARVNARLIDF